MVKLIVGFGVLSLCGFLSVASVGGEPPTAPPTALESADVGLRTRSDFNDGTVELSMSPEERDRREGICDQLLKNCRERCMNWKLKGDKLRDCRDTCNANWDDCIADIK